MFPEPVPDRLMQIALELWSKEEQEQAQKNLLQPIKGLVSESFQSRLPGGINQPPREAKVFLGHYYQGLATQETVQQCLKDKVPHDELGEPIKETKAEKSSHHMKIYGVEIEKAWKNATSEQKDDVQAIREVIRVCNEEEKGDREVNEPVDIHAEGLR
ncbi:hypothetical protein BDN71DRAFT_1508713 [Pleurotus eryngii]|uniref:Uncharacterized protein n=1 Tax=Pleurotus eryngii TaxID=5323 RepID=A0A9P5ZS42_PLEER|nr:hypothetical protein BDN71DRAFT_1508713 [Pleurotus eryngii]